ncbi:hypothetical protein [Celeribacter persicus]|uniref:Uncharacterized protein n=1 Tax=Celeribacter persicus TaxID=1651082 RepID=A0A2T5HMF7_9RHOB|nr:hypothetical protein [Celeribacter persicus]PTQ72734.1 hypothetical protein C8N42_106246 [Celeribacter persicus]
MLSDKEIKVLECFIGDECEHIGKVSRIGPKTWHALEDKGLIERCENDEGYRITEAGKAAIK